MSRGINRVTLIGNLGADPVVRQMTSGGSVANVSLATSDSWKNKQTGDIEERTEWHRVIFFNRLAEIVAQYLHKGSKIYVEGSIRTRKWTDQNGVEKYTTEIIAKEMQMLDGRGSDDGQVSNRYGNYSEANSKPVNNQPAMQQNNMANQPAQQTPQVQGSPMNDVPDFDPDDIPF